MIEPINDIDRLLQAAPSRYGEAYARSLQLSASARGFDVALDATVTPSVIVFIASRVGFTGGTVEFSTNNGTPLEVAGDVATLTPAALMGSGCEIVATVTYQGDTHVGRQSVTKLLAFDSSVPPAPTGLTAQGALASINLNWDAINDTNIATVEIWRALTNDIAAAAPIGKTAGLARTYPDVIGAGGKFYYWIRYISKANVLGPFNTQAGTLGTTGTGAEHLLELLKDQITESQLLASLRDRINLAVTGSEGVATVAAALQAETDARIAAIDKEISDRLAGLRDEAAAREAYVQNYTYSTSETDQALAMQAQAIAAAFTSYTDQVAQQVVAVAAADVRSYGYSRADAEAAEAAQSNAITTAYKSYADGRKDEAVSTAAADVRNYAYSKTDTNGALSSLATTLRGEMASNGGVSEAYVQSYAYSKAEVNSSITGQSTALTTAYKQYADDRKGEAISAAAADVRNYAYSKSDTNNAIASSASDLRAEFSDNNGATAAWVQEYAYSKAQTNEAIASQTSTLSSTVGQHTSTLQTQGTSINGLSGQYTVKIDNSGYVTGYGLASSYVNGIPTSAFIINADRFAVVAPGQAPKVMFAVGNVAGQSSIGLNGKVLLDGSVDVRGADGTIILSAGSSLAQQAATNPNLVPNCKGWTFFTNGASGNRNGDVRFGDGQYFFLPPSPDARYVGVESPNMGIPPGSIYTVSFDVYCEGPARYLNVDIVGGSWDSDGLGVNVASNVLIRYKFTEFAPNNGDALLGRLRFFTIAPGGSNIIIANVKVELGSVVTPWCDSVITPFNADVRMSSAAIKLAHIDRATIGNLAAFVAYLGNVEIGPGGALRQGQTGYDQGIGLFFGAKANGSAALSMATPNGGKILCDPENNVLEVRGASLPGLTLEPPSITPINDITAYLTKGTVRAIGSITISPYGGRPPYKNFSIAAASSSGEFILSGVGTASIGFSAGGYDEVKSTQYVVSATDQNGLTVSTSFTVTATFGTPA